MIITYIYFGIVAVFAICLFHAKVPSVRYYVKFATFVGITYVGSWLCMLPFTIRGRSYQNTWILKHIYQLAGHCIGLRPRIEGAQYLSPEQPHIYLSNHQSLLDIATLGAIWPRRCIMIVKSSLVFAVPNSIVMWLAKFIFINRSQHQSAVNSMKYASEVALSDQVSVIVFPEGTRSTTGLLPFEKGAFHLAISCQFPIQPIVIAPYDQFLNHKTKRFDSAPYVVQVLPAIPTEGKSALDVNELVLHVQSEMKRCYTHLNQSKISNEDHRSIPIQSN